MLNKKQVSVDISIGSIFWVFFTILLIFVILKLTNIIILLFTSILIALAVCPFVDWLEKRKINRTFSSLTILLSFFAIFIYCAVTLATPLFEQSELFFQKLPDIIDKISPVKLGASSFTPQFAQVPGQVLNIVVNTFSGFITILTMIVLSFYIIQEMHNLKKYLVFWFGEKGHRYFEISEKLEAQVGFWVRGEFLLMFLVGIFSYLGYILVGLPFAIPLGFMAGILELIPNIGPIVATIPAVLVGLSVSPTHAIAALIVQLVVQQLENNLIVPKVMQKTVGLNPIVTIISIMVGLQLGGPLLAVLALPTVLVARVIMSHIRLNKSTTIPELD